MKVHPIKLPLFVYGTLKKGEKYDDTFKGVDPIDNIEAFTLGTLYFVPYVAEKVGNKKKICVTVALDPVGRQRISGQLLTFDDSVANQALAESDDKEFNFQDQSTRNKKDRVFIRTIVTCFTMSGESVLAWAYIYVSRDGIKPIVLVNRDTDTFGIRVGFPKEEVKFSTYEKMLKDAALIEKLQNNNPDM